MVPRSATSNTPSGSDGTAAAPSTCRARFGRLIDRAYMAGRLAGRQLPPPLADPPAHGTHAVQILRTYPARLRRYPFAPLGERSIDYAYRKMLKRARRLIYVEDQYLWAPFVADLFADALRANPDLHLIAIVPRFPDKEGMARWPSLVGRQQAIRVCRSAGRDRFAIYDVENAAGHPVYVHSKVVVVDDVWAMIGSDNLNRRSWTHDSELSVRGDRLRARRPRSRRSRRRRRRGPTVRPRPAPEADGGTPRCRIPAKSKTCSTRSPRSMPSKSVRPGCRPGTTEAGRAHGLLVDYARTSRKSYPAATGRGLSRCIGRSMTPTAGLSVTGSLIAPDAGVMTDLPPALRHHRPGRRSAGPELDSFHSRPPAALGGGVGPGRVLFQGST